MMKKVNAYLKKGFLMLLVTAMVCSGSGISALASTTVVTDDAVAQAMVSENSMSESGEEESRVEEPQAEESQATQPQAEEQQEAVAATEAFVAWNPEELAPDAEASDSTEVEYIYAEGSESVSGINLNGNSVIIKASENDDTSGNRLINIIIDKDKDGVIDDGEEPVEINGSTDLMGGPTIYGYYNETEVTEPISITSISGYTPVIFGVYKSSLKTSGETAVTMRLLGGEVPGYFYAANESQVISTGAPAVEIYVDTESTTSTSQIMGALSSEVKVSAADKPGVYVEMNKGNVGGVYAFQNSSYTYTESTAAAVKMDVNGAGFSSVYGIQGGQVISDGNETALFDIDIKAPVYTFYGAYSATLNAGKNTAMAMDIDVTDAGAVTGSGYGVYGGNSSAYYSVTGNVDVNCAPEAEGTDSNIYYFYGVAQYLRVDGNVTMKVENARGYSVYAANYYCDITGDVILDVPEGNELTSSVYGLYYSKCGGDLTVHVHGCTVDSSWYGDVYGFYGRYGSEPTTVVGGDFTFDYLGGRCDDVYAGYGYYSSNGEYDKIAGKANITIRKGEIYYLYLLYYVDVTGDVTATVGDFTTDLTVSDNELESCKVFYSFYPFYYCNAKSITYRARITNENADNKPYCYGVYYCNVSGDVKVEVDGGCYNYVYGTYYSNIGGNVDVQIKNVNKDNEKISNGGTSYGVSDGNISGNVNVNIEDCNFYGLYATDDHISGGTVTSTIKNVEVYNYLYGASPESCAGDVVSTMENIKASYVYGVYQSQKIEGNVTATLKNVTQNTAYSSNGYIYGFTGNSSYSVEKDVKVTMENCSFTNGYGISGGAVMGNLDVDITGGTYGSTTENTYNYFASPSYVKGTTTIDVEDVTYYGNVYPYSGWYNGSGSGDVTITVENTQFNAGYSPDYEQFSMYPSPGQKVTVTLDEDCNIADTLKIYAGNGYGEGKITYDGETYIGGAIRFTEDTTYDSIHFAGGSLHIEEDVTLKADEFYWDSGDILLDGTLDVNVMNAVDEEAGVYPNTTVYMAGGTMNVDLGKIKTVYWPFEVNYKAKGGTVAQHSTSTYRPSTHTLGGNRLFAKVGQEIKYIISAAEGYTLASVTYTANEESVNVPNSGTEYTMTMPNAAVSFDVDFQGNQIVVGKTVTDPVLKLNEATTEEAPAYDLSTLSISNDGELGEVTYKVDSTYTLPEGLSLEGDKIVGTPTVAYEDGKKTIIHVTGKNDTSVELPINFVITGGEGTQTSQDGRIVVDDENLMIYTNGNSVVIETEDNQTAIYLDDNRDGTADCETPAVIGDYTNYTLYGLRNTDFKNPIRITMNGGTIGTVYGAQNGDITADGHGLEILINGGSVGTIIPLDTAKVSDLLKLVISKEASVTNYTAPNTSDAYVGYFYTNQGTTYIYKEYDITEDVSTDTLWFNGNHIIHEGATVKAKNLYRHDSAIIKLRGTLLADTCAYNWYGKVIVQGGTLPENCSWDYIYYPAETSTNLGSAYVTFTSNYYNVVEDGVTTTYLRAANSVGVTIANAPGYDFYYSLNEAEMVKVSSNTFTITGPRENVKLDVTYVPKQISLGKRFADPTGVVGTEYTATAPLYDLRGLTIVDDTTATYGGEVKYALKNTSVLPEGLVFEDGRVIGTPATVDMEGTTVSFVVTGRNGTTETIDVVIKIAGENYKENNINDLVAINTSYNTIDLQGTSVVVIEDPLNSNNCQIFLDENQDGTADNNNALVIGTSTSYDLSRFVIYGYRNTETAFEGDITITVNSGTVGSIYGVYGSSKYDLAEVKGMVTLNLGDAYISGTDKNVWGAYCGDVEDVKVSVTDGYYAYVDFRGAYNSTVNGNVNFTMADELQLYTYSSSSSYHIYVYPVITSTVTGNVNMRFAAKDSTAFLSNAYRYSTLYGVYDSEISGNVVCDFDGYWYTGNCRLICSSEITGNVNVNIADGATWRGYNSYPYLAYSSTIEGDTSVQVAENASFTMYGLYVFYNTKGKNITVDIPVTAKNTISPLGVLSDTNSSVTGGCFVNQRGSVSITGVEYTISENLEATGISLNDNVKVTIAKDVDVKTTYSKLYINTGAKLINNGTLDVDIAYSGTSSGIYGTLINNGTLKNTGLGYSYYFPIAVGACVVNNEGATWDVAGSVYNLGKIVNYGTFNQTYTGSYNYYLGTIYTTQPLTLTWDPATTTSYKSSNITYTSYPYADIFYPVTMEYPSHVLENMTISGDAVSTSGVEGDDRQYVRALHPDDISPTFTVTLGKQTLNSVSLNSVTYGPNDTLASEQKDGSWIGFAQNIFEAFSVKANFEASGENVTKITLDKTEDKVENTENSQPLVYNKYYSYSNPLYNLTTIEIRNDLEEGDVSYFVDSASTLPKGMYFKDGRLYGTLKEAMDNEQEITFIVKGRNQTSAFFTLTLGPVAKQVPTWAIPSNLSGLVGETLEDVSLPYSSYGTYSWPDTTVSLGDEVKTLEDQTLLFTPNDTDNYDWAAVAENVGATYADGVITCKADVQVCAGTPTYTAPETITTTYGKTYGEVPIPAGDNDGTFEWYYASTSKVGNVGTYTRWITYIPNDKNYQTVSYIQVTLVVEPATPTYEKITSVSQECGSTLADILLPDAEGGKYQWITTTTTIPLDGKTYQVGFKPDDTTNYDWTKIEGWNEAWKCVVFPITVYVEHTYSTELTYDETHHWYPCLDETCDSTEGKEEHLWDEGFVTKEATVEEEGVIEYSCTCGAAYEDVIPKLTHADHTYTGEWKYDAKNHWKQCTYQDCVVTNTPAAHTFDKGVAVSAPTASAKGEVKYTCTVCKYVKSEYLDKTQWVSGGWSGESAGSDDSQLKAGEEFTDPVTKAKFKVKEGDKEVMFLAPENNAVTTFTIPGTVKINNVSYLVTEIAPDAFKGNKKLKSIKIGSNIRVIGARAFYGCTKLKSVTMGANVEVIGNSAFQNCTSLKKFTIPKSVIKIGSKAFFNCKKLTKMTIKTTQLTQKNVGKKAFTKMGSSNYKKTTVKVPKKKLKVYKKMLVKRGVSKKAKIKK